MLETGLTAQVSSSSSLTLSQLTVRGRRWTWEQRAHTHSLRTRLLVQQTELLFIAKQVVIYTTLVNYYLLVL